MQDHTAHFISVEQRL